MTDGYRAMGFAHLRAALDPALVTAWRPIVAAAAARLPNRAGGDEIAAVLQPDRVTPSVARILCAPELGRIAADKLATRALRLIAAAVCAGDLLAPGSVVLARRGRAAGNPLGAADSRRRETRADGLCRRIAPARIR